MTSVGSGLVGVSRLLELVASRRGRSSEVPNAQLFQVFLSDFSVVVDIEGLEEGVDVLFLRVV